MSGMGATKGLSVWRLLGVSLAIGLGLQCSVGTDGSTRSEPTDGGTDATPNPWPDGACFGPGTRVATPAGERPIEELRVGDWVLAYDEVRYEVVPQLITATQAHPWRRTGRLAVESGRVLHVTPEHPLYLPDEGRYAPAFSIAADQRLLALDANSALHSVVSRRFEPPSESSERTTVYDITVANLHNFFAEGVLVHNKPPPCNGANYASWCPQYPETGTWCTFDAELTSLSKPEPLPIPGQWYQCAGPSALVWLADWVCYASGCSRSPVIDRDARGIIMGPGSSAAGEGGGAGSSADAGLMDSGAGGAAGFGGASSFGGAAGFGGAVSFGGAAGFGGFVGEDGGSSGAGNPAPTLVGVGITTCSNQRRSYQVVVSTLETRVTGELALATGTTPCEVGAFGERVRFELEPGERETLSLLAPNALPHLSLWYISRDQPATPVHLESVYPDGYF